MSQPTIGVIGGSGLYEIEGLTELREVAPRHPLRRTFRRLYHAASSTG